jgi:hypothetical protein
MKMFTLPRERTAPLRKRLESIDLPGLVPNDKLHEDGGGQMTYRGKYPKEMAKLMEGVRPKHEDTPHTLPSRVNLRDRFFVVRCTVGGIQFDFGTLRVGYYSQAIEKPARLADAIAFYFKNGKTHGRYNFPWEQAAADCEVPALKALLEEWRRLFVQHGVLDPLEHCKEVNTPSHRLDVLAAKVDSLNECRNAQLVKLEDAVKDIHKRLDTMTEKIGQVEANCLKAIEQLDNRLSELECRGDKVGESLVEKPMGVRETKFWCDIDNPFGVA